MLRLRYLNALIYGVQIAGHWFQSLVDIQNIFEPVIWCDLHLIQNITDFAQIA